MGFIMDLEWIWDGFLMDFWVLGFGFGRFASKIPDFASQISDFASKILDFASKIPDFASKISDFGRFPHILKVLARAGPPYYKSFPVLLQ